MPPTDTDRKLASQMDSMFAHFSKEISEMDARADKRLDRLDESLSKQMTKQHDAIFAEVKKLDHHVTGNGTPEKGILTRLDRIEQRSLIATWIIGCFSAASIVAIVTTVVGWIRSSA